MFCTTFPSWDLSVVYLLFIVRIGEHEKTTTSKASFVTTASVAFKAGVTILGTVADTVSPSTWEGKAKSSVKVFIIGIRPARAT